MLAPPAPSTAWRDRCPAGRARVGRWPCRRRWRACRQCRPDRGWQKLSAPRRRSVGRADRGGGSSGTSRARGEDTGRAPPPGATGGPWERTGAGRRTQGPRVDRARRSRRRTGRRRRRSAPRQEALARAAPRRRRASSASSRSERGRRRGRRPGLQDRSRAAVRLRAGRRRWRGPSRRRR